MDKLKLMFVALPTYSPNMASMQEKNTVNYNIFPPLGILSLATHLDKGLVEEYWCADFSELDYNDFGQITYEELVEKVLLDSCNGKNPDVIGISLSISSSYHFFKLICKVIRNIFPKSIIVVGGVHTSNSVEHVFNENDIDYIIAGEGEIVLNKFLEAIRDNGKPADLVGVHAKGNIKKTVKGKYEMAPVVEDTDMDFTLFPKLLNMDFYTKHTSVHTVSKIDITKNAFALSASRGCPCSCTFCAVGTVHGHIPRWRSFENVRDEIIWLNKNYDVETIYLMDDNWVPANKTIDFFNYMSELKIPGLKLVIQNLSVNYTSKEMIDAMINAGIDSLTFAIESGNVELQKLMNKHCNLDKAQELVSYAQSKGLSVRCFYIIGFPNETVSQMQETIEFAKNLNANWSNISVAQPIPGTVMYQQFIDLGYLKDDSSMWGERDLRDRVFDTKEITADALRRLAYSASLEINFVNNYNIVTGDYEGAKTIFENFVHRIPYHVIAYDCLRRIYKALHDKENYDRVVNKIRDLMKTDKEAQHFLDYKYLLDEEGQKLLEN